MFRRDVIILIYKLTDDINAPEFVADSCRSVMSNWGAIAVRYIQATRYVAGIVDEKKSLYDKFC